MTWVWPSILDSSILSSECWLLAYGLPCLSKEIMSWETHFTLYFNVRIELFCSWNKLLFLDNCSVKAIKLALILFWMPFWFWFIFDIFSSVGFLFVFVLVYFKPRYSLCSLGWPRIYVDQVALELVRIPLPASASEFWD